MGNCGFKKALILFAVTVIHCSRHCKGGKLFSIGDLHGDWDRFKDILGRLGLATFEDEKAQWTGGTATLVSTGDIVDRGDRPRPIYLAFQELAKQAKALGGEVINLIGNHELMNLQQDLRYVHRSEYDDDGDYGGKEGRKKEWSMDGIIGKDIRTRFLAAAVRKGILFVHGGLDPEVLKNAGGTLEQMDKEVKALLDAERVGFDHQLAGQTGPFWNRDFAEGREAKVCPRTKETLSMVGAESMVIGHTPQDDGEIKGRCRNKDGFPTVILADTVISRAYEASFGFSRGSAVEYESNCILEHYFPEGEEGSRTEPLDGWEDSCRGHDKSAGEL